MQPRVKGRFGSTPLTERFLAKVKKTDSCWLWTGTLSDGYGSFWNGNKPIGAHRVSWELSNGRPVPKGLELDHLCRVRACVNPDHLEAVTHAVNSQRSPLHGKYNRRKTHCSKGHEFDEKNTHYRKHKDGIKIYRMCRTCSRIRAARYYARKIKLTADKESL